MTSKKSNDNSKGKGNCKGNSNRRSFDFGYAFAQDDTDGGDAYWLVLRFIGRFIGGLLVVYWSVYWLARAALRAASNSSLGFQMMVVGAERACQPRSMPKRTSLALPAKFQSG